MPSRLVLALSLTLLLLFSAISPSYSITDEEELDKLYEIDDDADRALAARKRFIARFDDEELYQQYLHEQLDSEESDDDDDEDSDSDEFSYDEDSEDSEDIPEVDDNGVVVLEDANLEGFLKSHRFVMVHFYTPEFRTLEAEYAAAATELKGEDVVLAKMDADEETEWLDFYNIQTFPTVYFFVDSEHKPYTGELTKDAIVTWIKKKIRNRIFTITTVGEAEKILSSENKVALAYLGSLEDSKSEELAAASRLDDNVNFYQTVDPEVAMMFHINPNERPSLVMLKETQKFSHFDGKFIKSEILEFVFANKLPLVTTFTRETAPIIFESSIEKQMFLFATSNDSKKFLPVFEEAAKFFEGKITFVYVEMDKEDIGKHVSHFFGVTGDAPKVLAYDYNAEKFLLEGEVTLNNVKAFGDNFLDSRLNILEEKLKPFFKSKSDPIPETNDGDVKIVVGNNFDEIVLNNSKNVILQIYASQCEIRQVYEPWCRHPQIYEPWCGPCNEPKPTFNKLAKYLRGIDSLVMAKMDGITNKHPRAQTFEFPTYRFFPIYYKSRTSNRYNDGSMPKFYKFLKKHTRSDLRIPRPESTPQPGSSEDSIVKSVSHEVSILNPLSSDVSTTIPVSFQVSTPKPESSQVSIPKPVSSANSQVSIKKAVSFQVSTPQPESFQASIPKPVSSANSQVTVKKAVSFQVSTPKPERSQISIPKPVSSANSQVLIKKAVSFQVSTPKPESSQVSIPKPVSSANSVVSIKKAKSLQVSTPKSESSQVSIPKPVSSASSQVSIPKQGNFGASTPKSVSSDVKEMQEGSYLHDEL